MNTILLVLYIVGFMLTCGVLMALFKPGDEPGAFLSALFWPLFIPTALVYIYARRYVKAREEREKILREIESEL